MKKAFVAAALLVLAVLLPAKALAATEVHTVIKGDSLWKIAVKYQVGLSEIIAANPGIKNPELIYPGDRVYIPTIEKDILSFEEQVVQLTNQRRAENGVGPLSINWEVSRLARMKSQDMVDKKYFSHISPTYGSPFDMLKSFGISYRLAGENIAMGYRTPAEVVTGWMNSPGHRKNILNPEYTQIGVGYVANGHYWTQIFLKK